LNTLNFGSYLFSTRHQIASLSLIIQFSIIKVD
jgi:hypothetical protein